MESISRKLSPGIYSVALIMLFVTVFAFLAAESATTHCVMIDELSHVPSGLAHLERGMYHLFRESPPLIDSITAIPVWLSDAQRDYSRSHDGHRTEIDLGVDFVRANRTRFPAIYRSSRTVVILLSITCGLLVFAWSRRVHGWLAASVCAALWFFDPNVIAHSSMATSDIGTALMAVASTLLYWKFLGKPSLLRMVVAGVALGLALASKFSLLALLPAWAIMTWMANPPYAWGKLGLVSIMGLIVLNSVYRFDGTLSRLGSFEFRSQLLSGVAGNDLWAPAGNRFVGTFLDRMYVPLPRDYVLGIDSLKQEEEIGLWNIRGGELVRGGRWWSPWATLGIKMPLGTLILMLAGLIHWWKQGGKLTPESVAILAPASMLLVGLSCYPGMNWAYRHALPALPFAIIAVGGIARTLVKNRTGQLLLSIAVIANIASTLMIRPSYLSFANELVGGPTRAQRWLLGSNYDWGQDLELLQIWQTSKSLRQPLALTYYGALEPDILGIKQLPLPNGFLRGIDVKSPASQENKSSFDSFAKSDGFYWAISSNVLHGMSSWFVTGDEMWAFGHIESSLLTPEKAYARIGYSIYVFRILPAGRRPADSRPWLSESELSECIVNDIDKPRVGTP